MKNDRKTLRERLLRKKPTFRRHLYHRFIKFQNQDSWRKPKGNDNKMRLKLKGYPPIVQVGYRNPRIIRGLHPSGLEPVVVRNEKMLEHLDPSKHIIILSGALGLRKKLLLASKAREMGYRIANEGWLSANE